MVPRGRQDKADKWLPNRVYRGRTSYEWHPKGGGSVQLLRIERDSAGEVVETPAIRLALLQAYDKAKAATASQDNVTALIDAYLGSAQYRRLAASTQADYLNYRKVVEPVFGKMDPRRVQKHHVRRFMDHRGETQGFAVSANRCLSFLSTVFGWGWERGHCDSNPCAKVRNFKENPRDRYVEDWEYEVVYEVAARHSHYSYIAPLMELIYLCRLRPNEACALTEDDIREDGIFAKRGKGSDSEITGWSDRLRAAVEFARSLREGQARRITGQPLVTNTRGGRIIIDSFKTAFPRVRKIAMEHGVEIDGEVVKLKESFHAHDLKAKGLTDHPEKYAGHRSEKMRKVYNRQPDTHQATK